MLEYSLAISTYGRPDALSTCLRLAVTQTRPPREIVVADASDDWRDTRQRVLDELAPLRPSVRWRYAGAAEPSSTAQRNQTLDLATSEVLFMIDDDSYMYPSCAEHIMAVYDADRQQRVVGVGALERWVSPLDAVAARAASGSPPLHHKLALLAARPFEVERLLLPYDGRYREEALPAELEGLDVAPTDYLQGLRMTWRAGPARRVRFDPTLKRYAAAEDVDFSYRMSRHGLIVNACKAYLFHAQDPQTRLTRHTRALLGLTNLAYLYKRNGAAPQQLLRRYRRRLWLRAAADVARDALRARGDFPYTRADLRALRLIPDIAKLNASALTPWYSALQDDILSRNAT